jgi:WD40 repeat protein
MTEPHYEWARAEERALARYVAPDDLPSEFRLPPEVNRLDVLVEQKAKGVAKLLYQQLCAQNIQYDLAPFNPRIGVIQSIRRPATILAEKRGTCLDLAVLFATMCLDSDLLALIVVVDGHAFAGISLTRTRHDNKKAPQALAWDKGKLKDLNVLQGLVESEYLFIECTGAAQSKKALSSKAEGSDGFPERLKRDENGLMSFEYACEAGQKQLLEHARLTDDASSSNQRAFLYALDINDLQIKHGFEPVKPKREGDEPPAHGKPPFMGLKYFDEDQANLFFGREELTAKLVSHLREDHFLALVGASGSGKSSVIRAGLVPALRRGEPIAKGVNPPPGSSNWSIHIIKPSSHPLEVLATELTRDLKSDSATLTLINDLKRERHSLGRAARDTLSREEKKVLLLIVDQFEELFTLCKDEAERKAFVDNLLDAVTSEPQGPVIVVLTLRADFYAHCFEFENLRPALEKWQVLIAPMNIGELRRAIEEPARRDNWEFEPELVETILREVGSEPGALPLLSHALLETWERRRGRRLTHKGYAESGGVRQAIAQTAKTVYEQLTPEERLIARRIFVSLTELGKNAPDTRRRAPLSELSPRPEDQAVLQTLADKRLITIEKETAEVAHEVLIREWPTLRHWLDEDRETIALQNEIAEDARTWEQNGHDSSYLYKGARLATAREKLAAKRLALSELAQTFVKASQETEDATRRTRNRITLLVGSILFAAAVISVLFGLQAKANARLASARELAAHAVSNLGIDPELSLMLGIQSIQTTAVDKVILPEAEDSLHRALGQVHILRTLSGSDAPLSQAVFSPDGKRVATAGDDGVARVWDLRQTGAEVLTLQGHSDQLSSVAFSPDGQYLATASWDDTAKIWELSTGQELFTLSGHEDDVYFVAFSPNGKSLATASGDGTVKIWDVTTGQEISTFGDLEAPLFALTFSPDGQRLAASGDEGTASVWDITTGEKLLTLATGNADAINQIVFSPDGNTLATAGYDHTVRLWEAATGKSLLTLTGHTDGVVGLAFSHDGQRLATASTDASIKIWEVATGRLNLTLAGHQKEVTKVDFSPDGRQLVSSSRDGTIKIWDVSPESGQELVTEQAHTDTIYTVVYSPDSQQFATASKDGTTRVWDSATGQSVLTLRPTGESPEIYSVAFTPDGKQLVTGGCDEFDDEGNCLAGTVTRWNATNGQALSSFLAHQDAVSDLAISPDGQKLATDSWDGTAKLWDLSAGTEIRSVTAPTDGTVFNKIAFSPDGALVAITSYDETDNVFLWNTSSGVLTTLAGHVDQGFGVSFSPNGKLLATASQDGTAILWDVATGKALRTFQGHRGGVQDVAFSPDGQRLATASIDRTVMLWDVTTGNRLVTLYGHTDGDGYTGQVWSVTFSPNGQQLATASADRTVRRYVLPIENLLALAQTRLTRWFSPAECDKFFPQVTCPAAP